MKCSKYEKYYKYIIYFVFACLVFLKHIPMGYISDDVVVSALVNEQSLYENFLYRWYYNGRIFTDVLANVFYRCPIICWKIFDTGVYVLNAVLMTKIFTKDRWMEALLSCVLILLYPIDYLKSAGYIATTTNYIYPVVCLLMIMFYMKCFYHGERIKPYIYPVLMVAVLYATNHDQSAMVLLGGLFLYLVYGIITKIDKRITYHTSVWFGLSAISYVFMFMMPGHIYRMSSTAEMEFWLPQYADWSFFQKIYRGFSTTVANLFFTRVELVIVFCFLLMLLAVNQESLVKKIIGCIPLGLSVLINYAGKERFIVYHDYACSMPELIGPRQNIFPLLISLGMIACILFSIWNCIKSDIDKWMLYMLMLLAAGSREMMGFSATIYASSFRTFTVFLYVLMASALIMLRQMSNDEKNWSCHVGIGAIIILFI